MKYLVLTLACLGLTLSAHAQGTVNFNNFVGSGGSIVNARIYGTGGTSQPLGAGFMVALYAGPQTTDASALTLIGSALTFNTSGAGMGYINPSAGTTRTINSVLPGGTATIQLRAWDTSTGATWETATVRGTSALLDVVTGGAGSPPGTPANLVGLQSFQLVPEPSTIALGALGIGALFFARRRK
jgi:hypothetical protein